MSFDFDKKLRPYPYDDCVRWGGQWNSNHVPFANIAQGWNRWGLLKQTKERHASPNILME